MDYLPVFLNLRARPAVVVGGGHVAARKVELLLRSSALVTVVAPEPGTELQERVQRGELRHVAAPFEPAHLDGAALAIAATSVREVNAAVSQAARSRGIPVNVVDDPELSTFIFPAIIDRSPVIVAVGSGGHSPVLARRVREQIEALLPARLGALARFMGDRRKAVQQALAPSERRPFWERIIGGIVGSRVLAGEEKDAAQDFERELRASNRSPESASEGRYPGEVYLIGAGPGDPDLLTLRGLQLLQQADVVLYDRLVSDAVLDRARRDAQRIYVGKEPGNHHLEQKRINELLVHYARQGLRVARLKGGDPFIFGRGGEEAEVLAAHGIPFVVVPGITAAVGAAASAGIPLTHRRLASTVTFVTGHALDDETLDWSSLARAHHTVVFYMGVAHLPRIVDRLISAGAEPTHPVAIVERATLAEQRVLRGCLKDIVQKVSAAGICPPALLIVGDVAAFAAESTHGKLRVPTEASEEHVS